MNTRRLVTSLTTAAVFLAAAGCRLGPGADLAACRVDAAAQGHHTPDTTRLAPCMRQKGWLAVDGEYRKRGTFGHWFVD